MKRNVWKNKSNGQLCVTIPKNSGIKDGDIVNIEKEKIKRIVFTSITGDLFHFGHLQLLKAANELGDFNICGVLTDEAITSYKKEPVASLRERASIISSLNCVDMVVVQKDKDPTENLKEINSQFKNAKLILVHGDNWNKIPGSEYIKKVGGEVIKLPFYGRLSTKNVVKKIFSLYGDGDLNQ